MDNDINNLIIKQSKYFVFVIQLDTSLNKLYSNENIIGTRL